MCPNDRYTEAIADLLDYERAALDFATVGRRPHRKWWRRWLGQTEPIRDPDLFLAMMRKYRVSLAAGHDVP